jgi:phosphatidylserine synthase
MAAAPDDYGRVRASRADREQVISTLKAAFVQGRLTKDELDGRVARALVPQTYAELATLTDDLPAGLTPAAPPPENSLAHAGVYATLAAGMLLIATISNGSWNPLTVLGTVLFLSPFWLLALAGLLALHARLERRAAGRLPPGPGQ